jgi:hypothetical protein
MRAQPLGVDRRQPESRVAPCNANAHSVTGWHRHSCRVAGVGSVRGGRGARRALRPARRE